MKRLALLTALALAGCASNGQPPSPIEVLYAASATLDQTEIAAMAYMVSPVADPAIKAQIKDYDNKAYAAIHPLVDQVSAGQSAVTAVEADAAQAAVNALSSYLIAHGVK